MARRNRKFAEGTEWIRFLPRASRPAGEHVLIFQDDRKRQHTLPVHTVRWTPYPAEMIDLIKASTLAKLLEFASKQPQEEI